MFCIFFVHIDRFFLFIYKHQNALWPHAYFGLTKTLKININAYFSEFVIHHTKWYRLDTSFSNKISLYVNIPMFASHSIWRKLKTSLKALIRHDRVLIGQYLICMCIDQKLFADNFNNVLLYWPGETVLWICLNLNIVILHIHYFF